MDVGEVKAKLTADLGGWSSNLTQAQRDLTKFGTAAVAVGELLARLATVALSAAKDVLTFPLEAAKAAGKAAEQFSQLSQRTGIAIQSLQGLQVSMERVGLQPEALAISFRKLSGEMVAANQGNAKAVELFQQLGVSGQTLGQGTGSVLFAIAERFKGMADGAEKSRLAVELFGRAGLQLIPILNQGAAGLEAGMKKSAEFGLILTNVQQKNLETFDDAMDDLQSSLKGFTAQVGAAFAPALTRLVEHMTNAVVAAKDAFNLFADAGEKLMIRLSAINAVLDIVGQQLFSLSIFSREAWKQTLEQVKAIDAWAAAQIKGVDAARQQSGELEKLAQAQLKAGAAARVHGEHQRVLGEQIVAATTIQLKEQARVSAEIFQQLMDQEEQQANAAYLQGPKPRSFRLDQVNDAKAAADAIMALQSEIYQNETALIGAGEAARRVAFTQLDTELEQQRFLQLQMYEQNEISATQYYARLGNLETEFEAKRMAAIRRFPSFWEQQLQAVVQSNVFSMSTIVNQFSGAMASWVVQGTKFKQFWISLQTTLVQAILNLGVQQAAQMALSFLRQEALAQVTAGKVIAAHAGTEAAKTTLTVEGEAARAAVTITQSKVAGAASIAAITAIGTASIGVLEGIVVAIAGVFEAMAAALAASVVGSPFAPGMAAAGAAAFGAGSAAVAAASAAMTASIGTATAALALAEGGIVDRPTIALIGERGREAVVPLDGAGAGGFGTQVINVHVGRAVVREILRGMPREVRLNLGNAF